MQNNPNAPYAAILKNLSITALTTMQEAGIPNAVVETTQMLLAPAGPPQRVIERLAKEVKTIMAKPDVLAKMLKASFAGQYEGPEELKARIAREVPMWKDLVDRAGIKIN